MNGGAFSQGAIISAGAAAASMGLNSLANNSQSNGTTGVGEDADTKARADQIVDGMKKRLNNEKYPSIGSSEEIACVFPRDYHPNKTTQNNYWDYHPSKDWTPPQNSFKPMSGKEYMEFLLDVVDEIQRLPKLPPGTWGQMYRSVAPYFIYLVP